MAVAWSPQGKLIATASIDQKVRVWNALTANTVLTYHEHSGEVKAIAWSPGGTLIASAGSDRTVQVWNADTGKRIFIYDVHKGSVNSVSWSPDGKYLVSGSDDQTVQVWETKNGYKTFVNCGDSERVPATDLSHLNKVTLGYFSKDVHITWEYEVENTTGLLLTPRDHLPL